MSWNSSTDLLLDGTVVNDEPDAIPVCLAPSNTSVSPLTLVPPAPQLKPVVNDTIPFCELRTCNVRIGGGSIGAVYKTEHKNWGCVAYKQLGITFIYDARCIKELKHEAEIHRQLSHPNIVLMLGLVFEDDHYGLILEYVCYGSLDQFIKHIADQTGSPFKVPWRLKARMSHDMCQGMSYLHSLRPNAVIHGDLKMQNALVGETMRIKISDFGLSKWKEFSRTRTRCGTIQGTPSHIPPDYWRNAKIGRKETFDVYSAGILIWELFTEEPAWEGNSDEIMTRVINGQRPHLNKLPNDLPTDISDNISACWEQEPDSRTTFTGLLHAFKKFTEDFGAEIDKSVRDVLAICSLRQISDTSSSDSTASPHSVNHPAAQQSGDVMDGSETPVRMDSSKMGAVEGNKQKVYNRFDSLSLMPAHGVKMGLVSQQLCDFLRRTDQILQLLFQERAITLHEFNKIRTQSTPYGVARCVVNLLITKPEASYQSFLEALKVSDQNHLYRLLEEGVDMNVDHQGVLRDNYTFLIANLSASQSLLTHLIEFKVLNCEEEQEIKSKATENSKVEQLLSFIMRVSEDQYKNFLRALCLNGLQFIFEKLNQKHQQLNQTSAFQSTLQSSPMQSRQEPPVPQQGAVVPVMAPKNEKRKPLRQLNLDQFSQSQSLPEGQGHTKRKKQGGEHDVGLHNRGTKVQDLHTGLGQKLLLTVKSIDEDNGHKSVKDEGVDFTSSSFLNSVSLLVQAVLGKCCVWGVGVVGNQLFVARDKVSHVEVYDTNILNATPHLLKISDKPLRCPRLAVCSHYKRLYVCHISNFRKFVVYCVDIDNNSILSMSKWSKEGECGGLSIVNDSNLLVSLRSGKICEYTAHGELIREFSLDDSIDNPGVCVQLSDGNFVVSHCGAKEHRVCIVDKCGRNLRSYGRAKGSGVDQLNQAGDLSVDSRGHVLVADHSNNRVQLLSPELALLGTVQTPAYKLNYPGPVHFNKDDGRLYIGEFSGRTLVLKHSVTDNK